MAIISPSELCTAAAIVEDVVHHGRSTADRGDDHVAVDGLGYVG